MHFRLALDKIVTGKLLRQAVTDANEISADFKKGPEGAPAQVTAGVVIGWGPRWQGRGRFLCRIRDLAGFRCRVGITVANYNPRYDSHGAEDS